MGDNPRRARARFQRVWDNVVNKDGYITSNQLVGFLRDLRLEEKLEGVSRLQDTPASQDAYFCLRGMNFTEADLHDPQRLYHHELCKYYVDMISGLRGDKLNTLLVRPIIGRTKPGVHALPPEGYAYGGNSGRDKVKIKTLVEGHYYTRDDGTGGRPRTAFADPDRVYGAKSAEPEDMSLLMTFAFAPVGSAYARDAGYLDVSHKFNDGQRVRPGQLPENRDTRSSYLRTTANLSKGTVRPPANLKEDMTWKAPKYRNVAPRVPMDGYPLNWNPDVRAASR